MITGHLQFGDRRMPEVDWGHGISRRFLTAADGIGITITWTTVRAGTSSPMRYPGRIEAVICIEGTGELRWSQGQFALSRGAFYCLDRGEEHTVDAFTDIAAICVFVPALNGSEAHSFASG